MELSDKEELVLLAKHYLVRLTDVLDLLIRNEEPKPRAYKIPLAEEAAPQENGTRKKTCPMCRKRFIPKHANSTYCSSNCGKRHWYLKNRSPKYKKE